jgi:hypothetical protein
MTLDQQEPSANSPCTKTTFFVFSTHGPNCAGLLARSIRQFETWGHMIVMRSVKFR